MHVSGGEKSEQTRPIAGHFVEKNEQHFLILNSTSAKTITSQNVSSEAQVNNFFSWKNYILFFKYSSFSICNHPMIYQVCDFMMNISILDRLQHPG